MSLCKGWAWRSWSCVARLLGRVARRSCYRWAQWERVPIIDIPTRSSEGGQAAGRTIFSVNQILIAE